MDPLTIILTIVVIGLVIGVIVLANKKVKFGLDQAKAVLAEPGVEDHLPGVRAAIKALGAVNIVRQQATKLIAELKEYIRRAKDGIANAKKAVTADATNTENAIAAIRAEAEKKIQELETGHTQRTTNSDATLKTFARDIERWEAEVTRVAEIVDKLG